MKKHSQEDYHSLANQRGFKWIGPFPPNVDTHTKWECENGHVWDTTFGIISAGHGCPRCNLGRPRKYNEIDYHKLAQKMGLIWLGPFPRDYETPTKWECDKGHIRSTSFCRINNGSRCPQCLRDSKKFSESHYRAIAQTNGLEWLGPMPANSLTKTHWKCRRGHIFTTTYQSIRTGTGCRQCYLMDCRGENHPNFRGGSRTSKHYGNGFGETQKEQIRTRDKYTCMLTGEYIGNNGYKPDVHHIVPARIAPGEWKNSTHNLITLSRKMNMWADYHLEESIPLLRKILYDTYGYDFSDMQDYDLSRIMR